MTKKQEEKMLKEFRMWVGLFIVLGVLIGVSILARDRALIVLFLLLLVIGVWLYRKAGKELKEVQNAKRN